MKNNDLTYGKPWLIENAATMEEAFVGVLKAIKKSRQLKILLKKGDLSILVGPYKDFKNISFIIPQLLKDSIYEWAIGSGYSNTMAEILVLAITGKSRTEMADSKFRSNETINSALKIFYIDLKIHSRPELIFMVLDKIGYDFGVPKENN